MIKFSKKQSFSVFSPFSVGEGERERISQNLIIGGKTFFFKKEEATFASAAFSWEKKWFFLNKFVFCDYVVFS